MQKYVPVKPSRPRSAGEHRIVREHRREKQEAKERVDRLRQYVVKVLWKLRPVARMLAVFLVQPGADSEELRKLGFAAVLTNDNFASSFRENPDIVADTEGVIVVNVGAECQTAMDMFAVLDQYQNVPPSVAVLLQPGDVPSEGYVVELQQSRAFLDAGADDVMSLFGEEVLSVHRVMTAFERTKLMAELAARVIDEQTEDVTRNQQRAFQDVNEQQLWELPGNALEYIPPMDRRERESVRETHRIGDYTVTGELGAGAFGAVFKAEHPVNGTCAVKFMSKNDMRSIRSLIALNTELCIMMNLARHPNVVYAHEAMHFRAHIMLSMSFVGHLNLHSFVKKTLKESNVESLPPWQSEELCRQAAAGVGHLHSFWVCHRDIKPKNFVMTDDGRRLCLVDFGFARRVCGEADRMRSWLGSLPFVAPEVLRLRNDRRCTVGYSGLAADVWSLAVNFLELGCGVYTMEHLLGWAPEHPTETDKQLHDLEQLPAAYRRTSPIPVPQVHRAVERMLVLRADDRCTLEWVNGSECLGAPSAALR